jgi:hypothetical protein
MIADGEKGTQAANAERKAGDALHASGDRRHAHGADGLAAEAESVVVLNMTQFIELSSKNGI